MIIGYSRAATKMQGVEKQNEELSKAGCVKIYTDICSGLEVSPPSLEKMIKDIQPGDQVIAYDRSRISRSELHFQNVADILQEKGVKLTFIKDERVLFELS